MQFKKRENRRVNLDITPLIDVIFLLLIFFMVSTTFLDSSGIKINLPVAETKTPAQKEEALEVTISAKKKIYVNGKPTELKRLVKRLKTVKKRVKQDLLIIRADGKVPHQLVVSVMDAGKRAGIKKLSIATALPEK